MNNLHWEIETKNGLILKEFVNDFVSDPKEVKLMYFTDDEIYCGIKNDLTFFINHTEFNPKLNQNILKYFQYKESKIGLMDGMNGTIYNIGVNAEDNLYTYQYTLQISETNIWLNAKQFDGYKQINERNIKLL